MTEKTDGEAVNQLVQGLLGYLVSKMPDRELKVTQQDLAQARDDLGEGMVLDVDATPDYIRLFYRKQDAE